MALFGVRRNGPRTCQCGEISNVAATLANAMSEQPDSHDLTPCVFKGS